MGQISDSQARLLVGVILLMILLVSLIQNVCTKKSSSSDDSKSGVPAFATSIWFAAIIGVVGGFATILTNSMGPLLNVYLLTLQLDPATFVGTRVSCCWPYVHNGANAW